MAALVQASFLCMALVNALIRANCLDVPIQCILCIYVCRNVGVKDNTGVGMLYNYPQRNLCCCSLSWDSLLVCMDFVCVIIYHYMYIIYIASCSPLVHFVKMSCSAVYNQ